jgi:hypothetical protein
LPFTFYRAGALNEAEAAAYWLVKPRQLGLLPAIASVLPGSMLDSLRFFSLPLSHDHFARGLCRGKAKPISDPRFSQNRMQYCNVDFALPVCVDYLEVVL